MLTGSDAEASAGAAAFFPLGGIVHFATGIKKGSSYPPGERTRSSWMDRLQSKESSGVAQDIVNFRDR